MDGKMWIEELTAEYRSLKSQAERALAAVSEDDWFAELSPGTNNLAIQVKHLAGSTRSRWRDFLTTDGEKPDRDRDTEFELTADDTVASLSERWEATWAIVFDELGRLAPADLEKTVTIRGEPLGVVRALHRNLIHVAYHVGQIVLLAKHYGGESWRSLSVERGRSKEFNAAMREKYGEW